MNSEELYKQGGYLKLNPTWDVAHCPWKAKQVIRMLQKHNIVPATICEVGCGSGEILNQLQQQSIHDCVFWGYEISPQAFDLCQTRIKENLHFKLKDILEEDEVFFDLILLMDVIEHIENYFDFLRKIKSKSHYKVLHIPLDLTVLGVLLNSQLKARNAVGHIHYFSKDIALQMLKELNYEVVDYFYTPIYADLAELGMDHPSLKTSIITPIRKLAHSLHQDTAARLVGGVSLLVLAK